MIVMGAGMVLTAFIGHIWVGYLTYGVGVGVGAACAYVPTLAMVGGWFAHSAAYRRDAPATLAAPQSRPTTTLAHSVGFPSPSATLYYCQSILATLQIVTDFHHGLLARVVSLPGQDGS